MKTFKLFFLIFLFPLFLQAQDYDSWFLNKSLRVDFYLTGNDQHTSGILAQLKEEPYWGGPRKNRIDSLNYGNYRILVFDSASAKLLYSKGFCNLYGEWQTTDEAKKRNSVFYHAFQIPYPKKAVRFVVEERKRDGSYNQVLETLIDPANYFIHKEKVPPYKVENIQVKGNPENKIDIAILAEGYTEAQMGKFVKDTRRLVNYLFTIPPFDKLKNCFNIYAVKTPSVQSGTDIPGEGIYRNTIFNSSFYTFDTSRYLTISDMKSVTDAAACVPYDQLYVLVNSDRYGGGGFFNFITVSTVDHELSDKVFVHEFGHGFGGLADEYYESSTSYNDFYNLKIEPWEPNITTLVDFQKKWASMIGKDIPIPTPRTDKYKDVIGVFEGGGYSEKGIYSPAEDCRMKSNVPAGFCPVCTRAIEQMIKNLTE
ncbi:MAG: M64 family metallopeptidase [Bacteroidota bacterium]|nr:M64 family metallopeptidase [Bacteroidota bacterium]